MAFNDPLIVSLILLLSIRILGLITSFERYYSTRNNIHLTLILGWLISAIGTAVAIGTILAFGEMENEYTSMLAAIGTFLLASGALLYFKLIKANFIYWGCLIIFLYGFLPSFDIIQGPSPGVLIQILVSLFLLFIATLKKREVMKQSRSGYFWLTILAILSTLLTSAFGLGFIGPNNLYLGFVGTSILQIILIIFFLHLDVSFYLDETRKHVAFLNSTMDQSPFSMWISDTSGTLIKTNQALRKTLNTTDDLLIGKYNVFEDENLEEQGVMPQVKKVFSDFKPARFEIPWSGKTSGIDQYSKIPSLWLDVSLFPIININGKLRNVVCQWVNISDRKQAEAEKLTLEIQLIQQQKLESIGTLASGVAHEINNPITGIMNYAQLISERLDPKEGRLQEFADAIVVETKRIAEIVKNLLTFSRDEKQSHSPARMIDICDQTLSLIRTIIKRDQIELKVDIPDDLPEIKCRSQQIQQVLMNLLTNARDSLNLRYPEYDPDKIISIKVNEFEKDDRRWLRTTVEDHGVGIPDELSERIFDPFFTTKDRALGTGLGLSISLGIAKDHHGELTFESVENEYTRFHLILPVDNGWDSN